MSPLFIDSSGNTFVRHPNGQTTHYIIDDFTDPWRPCETVLIQPGFGRNVGHWYHWIPRLARHYRVIRRDLRGHGLSSYPVGEQQQQKQQQNQNGTQSRTYDYTADTILDEIIDLLDQLGIEKVHFLGESTSGMLGEILAATRPHRLHSLTICSSPTHLPPVALDMFALGRSSWSAACREMGSRGWAQAMAARKGTVSSPDPACVAWWVDQVAQSDGEGLAQYAEFLAGLDARPYLGRIAVPMLILAPMNSAVMRVEDMEAVAGQVKGSVLRCIDAPGHEIFTSGAEKCQDAALEFWKCLEKTRVLL